MFFSVANPLTLLDMVVQESATYQRIYVYFIMLLYNRSLHAHDPECRRIECDVCKRCVCKRCRESGLCCPLHLGTRPMSPQLWSNKGKQAHEPPKKPSLGSLRNYRLVGPIWYPMLVPMGPMLGPIWFPMVVPYHKSRNSVRFLELRRYVNI